MTTRLKFFMNRIHIAFLLSMAVFPVTGAARQSREELDQECVVLLHGLGRTAHSMKRLEWNLARHGYEVLNVSYPSRRFSVEQLADEYLHPAIARRISRPASKIHFVTHSMGGIVLRQYLLNHTIENPGRVVMLAPPNQGSEIVDHLKRATVGRWILGPGGCQLDSSPNGLPKRLGAVCFNLGVIAGDRSLNPLFSRILPGPDDGKISVESTRVAGMKDFLVVPNSHTWMPWRTKTISQVLNYLRSGEFNRDEAGESFRNDVLQ